MAKSHPAQFYSHGVPRYARSLRATGASFVLLACLISLGVILHVHQYGSRLVGVAIDRLAGLDATELAPSPEPVKATAEPNLGKYRAMGEYLARRYRVSSEAATEIVGKAYAIGHNLKLDPMLILAVISVESRFNPIAESTMGAKGLMQVIPRFHAEKFDPLGGEKMAFEPEANIIVGAGILKEYLRRTGDVVDALQMYVGATSDENDNGYSTKVMTERDRLNHVLRRYQTQTPAAKKQPEARQPGAAI